MVKKYLRSFDGTKIFYDINKNENKFLVFLHGWPHNHTVWNKQLNYFHKKKYSTLTLDLRGHGKSDKPKKLEDYSFDKFARDINLIIKKEKIKKMILIGHSFGGMIALTYYSLFPKETEALVLIDTIYEDPLKKKPLIKQFYQTPLTIHALKFILGNDSLKKKHFKYINFSKFKDHSDFFYWIKGAEETPMRSIFACFKKMIKFDKKKVLSKIDVPVLIIQGEEDIRTPMWVAKTMQKQIKKSYLKIIKGASHDTNIRNPNVVAEAILEFLKSL